MHRHQSGTRQARGGVQVPLVCLGAAKQPWELVHGCASVITIPCSPSRNHFTLTRLHSSVIPFVSLSKLVLASNSLSSAFAPVSRPWTRRRNSTQILSLADALLHTRSQHRHLAKQNHFNAHGSYATACCRGTLLISSAAARHPSPVGHGDGHTETDKNPF